MAFISGLIASGLGAIGSSLVGGLLSDNSTGGQLQQNQLIGSDELLAAIKQYGATNLAESKALYGKGAAFADAQGAIRSIFDEYSKTTLPQIYQGELGSGGYNSTTSQLMANDAFAATNTKAAATLLDTIIKYRGLEQQDFNIMSALVGRVPAGAPADKSKSPLAALAGDAIGAVGNYFLTGSEREAKKQMDAMANYMG